MQRNDADGDGLPTAYSACPEWADATYYAIGDVVAYNGQYWRCRITHTSSQASAWDLSAATGALRLETTSASCPQCGRADSCEENDTDGAAVCGDVDSCNNDAKNDKDSDVVCGNVDSPLD